MACHNRRDLTVRAMSSAVTAALTAGVDIDFTVFDDGSTDGTSKALQELDLPVQVISGDGSAFWASGMAQAERAVLAGSDAVDTDYLVWLNDDVDLDISALLNLRRVVEEHEGSVVVGAMRDAISREITYSGLERAGMHPLRFNLVQPTTSTLPIETFNGNLVVVPLCVARALNGIDGEFSHALADIDYGLRCGRSGIPVHLAAGTQGTCSRNIPAGRHSNSHDWSAFLSVKGGGNFASMKRILQKSNPASWWIPIMVTYVLWWMRRIPVR